MGIFSYETKGALSFILYQLNPEEKEEDDTRFDAACRG